MTDIHKLFSAICTLFNDNVTAEHQIHHRLYGVQTSENSLQELVNELYRRSSEWTPLIRELFGQMERYVSAKHNLSKENEMPNPKGCTKQTLLKAIDELNAADVGCNIRCKSKPVADIINIVADVLRGDDVNHFKVIESVSDNCLEEFTAWGIVRDFHPEENWSESLVNCMEMLDQTTVQAEESVPFNEDHEEEADSEVKEEVQVDESGKKKKKKKKKGQEEPEPEPEPQPEPMFDPDTVLSKKQKKGKEDIMIKDLPTAEQIAISGTANTWEYMLNDRDKYLMDKDTFKELKKRIKKARKMIKKGLIPSIPSKSPETQEEKPATKKADKPKPKPKKRPAGPGIIASILEFITDTGPITIPEIVEQLAERFPEKNPEAMAKTVRAQIGSKNRPCRMENEKKVTFKVKGEGDERTFKVK